MTHPDDLKSAITMLRALVTDAAYGSQMWDIVTAMRGPDSPSERDNMPSAERSAAYAGRRARKRDTVEVIRGMSVGQVGGARTRTASSITLPHPNEWDHFDKHCNRAASVLGLKVIHKPASIAPEPKTLPGVKVTLGKEKKSDVIIDSLTALGAFAKEGYYPTPLEGQPGCSDKGCVLCYPLSNKGKDDDDIF